MSATGIAGARASLKPPFLDGLTQSEAELVLAAGTQRRFIAHSVITRQGSEAGHLFLLLEGRARYFFTTHEGDKNLLAWYAPGEIFGGAALLSKPSPYLVSTEAVRDCAVLAWDRSTIRFLAARYPRLLENTLSTAWDYLNWYVATHAALTSQTARQRLAHVLICLAGVIGEQVPGGVEFDATNEELASAANISAFTASRLLNDWQRNRAIVKRRGKIVLRAGQKLFLRRNSA
jgi:CRP-like cAMP-binding protein